MTIGERIKAARNAAGLTQKALAAKCGLATGTIQQYELDKRIPKSREIVERLGNVLNVSALYLIWGIDVESTMNNELSQLDNMIRVYIKVLEIEGYEIVLGNETVCITLKDKIYTVSRKAFMSMLQYCHNDIENNMEKLLRTFE